MMRCADADPCLEPLLPAAREARGAIHVCMRVRVRRRAPGTPCIASVGMRAGCSAEGLLRVRVPAGGGRTARESAARRLYASSPEMFSSGFGKADLVGAITSRGVPGAHAIAWQSPDAGSSTPRYPMGMALPSTHVAPRPPTTDWPIGACARHAGQGTEWAL